MFAWFGGIAVDLREARARARRRPSDAQLPLRRDRDPRPGGLAGRVERRGRSAEASRSTCPSRDDPDAPTLTLEGFALFGGIAVGARAADAAFRELAACDGRRASSSRFPERLVRAVAASSGGTMHETAELVLPRLVRRSRLYEATAKNLLRITVELVGGVERPRDGGRGRVRAVAEKLAVRKGARQRRRARLDLRLRLLAALAPRGCRGRDARHARLPRRARRRAEGRRRHRPRRRARVRRRPARRARGRERDDRAPDRHPAARGRGAQAVALRPARGRRGLAEPARSSRRSTPASSARPTASSGACSRSRSASASRSSTPRARSGRQHVLDPYTEDLKPVRDEGFASYARRVGRPYAQAVAAPLRPAPGDAHRAGPRPARTGRSCLNRGDGASGQLRRALAARGRRARGRDLPARRAAGALRRAPPALHAADPARERPPARGRRDRHRRRRRGGRGLGRGGRAVAGDLVHARPRAAPGLHRRPRGRRPRGDAGRDARPRRRPGEDQPAAARPSSSSTTRCRSTSSRRGSRSRATPSSSSSATASATRSCAGARGRSPTSRSSRRARASSTRSTSSSSPASWRSETASPSRTRSSARTRTRR